MKYTNKYKCLIIWLVSIVLSTASFSQMASAKADRDKILIGEQISLVLKTENVSGIAQWFSFPDTVNHLEVVKRSKIDTIEIAGNQLLQQTITLTSFDSGQWQIPAITVVASNNVAYKTDPITVEVVPVDVSQLKDYHDIKEIVDVEETGTSYIVIIIAAITLLSLLIIFWLMRRKRLANAAPPATIENLTPVEWALRELEKLQAENLVSNGSIKQHYLRLTTIVRRFFYLQLHHKSMHQTTGEWMVSLQALPVLQDAKTSFLQLLRLADTVKFAKYLPPAFENQQSVETAKTMVRQIEALQNTGNPSTPKNN